MKNLDQGNSSGSPAPEIVTAQKMDAVTFERLMSFRPQVAGLIYGREPALRDIIFNYYAAAHMADADLLTKAYIAEIYETFGATQ